MNTLASYAISRKALQVLDPQAQGQIPDTWFNWVGGKPTSSAANVRRLCLAYDGASNAPWNKLAIMQWDRQCRELGYDTVLILTDQEEMAALPLYSLDDPDHSVHPAMGITLLRDQEMDREDNAAWLEALREPDAYLAMAFSDVRRGAGMDLGIEGYAGLTAFHWWTLACEFKRWATLVCETNRRHLFDKMFPLNDWNESAAFGEQYKGKNAIITVENFFHTAYSDTLRALREYDGPDKSWDARTLLDIADWPLDALADNQGSRLNPKLKAVYPMRTLPFCGVAETDRGDLVPYGGFGSLTNPWAWDDGAVKQTIQEWVKKRDAQNVGTRLKLLWNASVIWVRGSFSHSGFQHGKGEASAAHTRSLLFMAPRQRAVQSQELKFNWKQIYEGNVEINFALDIGTNHMSLTAECDQDVDWSSFLVIKFPAAEWACAIPDNLQVLNEKKVAWIGLENPASVADIHAYLLHGPKDKKVIVC